MKTSLFDFYLPDSAIATKPITPRDAARMLIVHDQLVDSAIYTLPQCLRENDIMVFNDTRVIPARLLGRRGEANIEILLHKSSNGGETWQCFAKPAKRLKLSDHIIFADDFSAKVTEKLPDGQIILRFNCSVADFYTRLRRYGQMPLPPYIKRKRQVDESDHSHYQTIYAAHDGSVAAPTAGLHFTQALLERIDAAGVARVHVTLQVGGGTFLPVKAEDTDAHVMHTEYASITAEAAERINAARAAGGRVIAVGTTSLRTLESAAADSGEIRPYAAETGIFITPGYRFKAVDILLTNFHLPRSTLFMLTSAFCGLEHMHAAYAHAIANGYRFYSYGDACLLYKATN